MPTNPPSRRQPIRGALLPLPMLVAALIWFGWLGGAAPGTAGNLSFEVDTGTAVNVSFGTVDATADFVAAPPMNQMMMPMHGGGGHDDQIQVVIQLRNDTDRPVVVPFGRMRLLSADGTEVAAVAGLLGDLQIRPHAAVEERLRFPLPDGDQAHAGDQVQLRIPDGDGTRTLTVSLHRSGSAAPSGSPAPSGSAAHVHSRDDR